MVEVDADKVDAAAQLDALPPVAGRSFNSNSKKHRNDVYESIYCGAMAGIAAKTAIAPAERIKMAFQVSSERFSYRKAIRRGTIIVKNEGWTALWKGHSTTVLRVAPYSGLSFAIHDYSEEMFKRTLKADQLPAVYKFLAGSIGGFGGTILTYPLDVFRVRLALGSSWAQAVKQGGMYQGLLPTLLGIVPYAGTAWWSKQTMLERFPALVGGRAPTVLESIAINAIAGYLLHTHLLMPTFKHPQPYFACVDADSLLHCKADFLHTPLFVEKALQCFSCPVYFFP